MERYKRITTTTTEGSKSDLMVERSSSGGETGFKEPTCQGLYPQRPHEPDCMFYRRTGSCEFGVTCRFNHPPDISSRYPERPKAPDCAHYLRKGSCKFGVSCKFNHPQQVSKQMPPRRGSVMARFMNSLLPQGMVAGSSFSSDQAPPLVSAVTSHSKDSTVGASHECRKINFFPSAPRSTGTGGYLLSSDPVSSSSNNQNKHTFVERPKFGSDHHPPEWSTPKTDSVLDPLALPGHSRIEQMTTRWKLDSKRWNKQKKKQKWLDSFSPEEQEFKSIKLMTNRLKLDSKQWNKKKDLLIHFVLSYPMKQVADQVDCFHLCKYTSKLNPLIRTLEAALKKKDIQILRDSLTELNDLLEVSWNKFCMSNFSSELEVYLPRGWSLYTGQLKFCWMPSFSVYGKPDCPEVILNRAITSSICLVSRCIMEERMKLIAISGHGAGKAVKALRDIPEIQSKFDVVLYISVSQHHSNDEVQMDITKQMHGHEFPTGTDSLLPLDEMLKPYNFLLVLDFIDGRIIDLYNLKIPFDHGCIVLATKSDDIYRIISVDLEIRMEYHLLPWELFSWHVGHVFHPSSTLQETAIRLIEECHGHLLAMILLARALKDVTDVGFWELALNELMLQPSSQVEEGMSQVMVRVLKFIWKSKGNIMKRCIEHLTTYGEGRIINGASLISCWLKDCLVETKEEGEVILADLIDSFLLEHFNGALRMREETRIVLSKQIMPYMGSQLTEGWMVKWNAERINLIDNGVSELPESPICSNLVFLFLQKNCDLMVIPSLFFECMPMLQVLDLSYTSIKTLPTSISRLVSLQKLLLRGCELFTELPPEVGGLSSLQVLDMEGTEIMYLPEEIKELKNLLLLKLSFYGYGNSYRESRQISKMIPQGVLSDLFLLKELSIDVNPEDGEWIADLKDIIYELQNLKRLTKLKLYLPKVELLKRLTVSSFRFTVGRHEQRMISRIPHEVEEEFKKHETSLRYINGERIPTEIKKTLKRTSAFFLDRHWTVKKLSEFGNANMINLKLCLLVECNELKTIIDEGRDYKCESDVDERLVLGSLEYLGIYYMKNLRSVCNGPIVKGCLSKLKFLRFRTCTSLNSIFTPGILGNLENLEELIVEDCPKIKSLVSHESTMVESTHFLPALKKMSLLELPELVSISIGLCIAPKLERLVIFYCPKLESLSTIDSKDLKVIKGESEWWDSLMWNESEWSKSSSYCQDYLASIFVPLRRERNLKAQLAMD